MNSKERNIELAQKIRNLVAKNETSKAFLLLENSAIKNESYLLANRWISLKEQIINGTLSVDQQRIECNLINHALLLKAESLESSSHEKSQSPIKIQSSNTNQDDNLFNRVLNLRFVIYVLAGLIFFCITLIFLSPYWGFGNSENQVIQEEAQSSINIKELASDFNKLSDPSVNMDKKTEFKEALLKKFDAQVEVFIKEKYGTVTEVLTLDYFLHQLSFDMYDSYHIEKAEHKQISIRFKNARNSPK